MPSSGNRDHIFADCADEAACLGKLRELIEAGSVKISSDGGTVMSKDGALRGIDHVPMKPERIAQENGFRVAYSNDLADWVGGRSALIQLGREFAAQQEESHQR